MPSLLSRFQQQGNRNDASASAQRTTLPLVLLISSILVYIGTSVQHSLLTSAIAWGTIWASIKWSSRNTSKGASSNGGAGRRLAWLAGGLLALAQVCERAVERQIWWSKGLLPLVIYLLVHSECFIPSDVLPTTPNSPSISPQRTHSLSLPTSGSKTWLAILTISAVVAIFAAAGSNATVALGLSYALIESLAFLLVERAGAEAQDGRQNGASIIYTTSGLLSQPSRPAESGGQALSLVTRDVSLAAFLATGVGALMLERFTFGGLGYWGILGQAMGSNWVVGQGILSVIWAVATVVLHFVMDSTILVLIQKQGTFQTSFVPLSAAICSQLLVNFSLSRLWFAVLCAASTFAFLLDEQDTQGAGGARVRMRFGRILTLIAILSFGVLTVLYLKEPYQRARFGEHVAQGYSTILRPRPPPEPLAPQQFTNTRVHPIDQLVRDAEASWLAVERSQSQTLEAAVTEYKRRYRIPPPPNFDKWYEYAKRKEVQLIDEYDTIYDNLLPFWGVSPETIRSRTQEAIGYDDNFLMGLMIRDGKATFVNLGTEWYQQAVVGMIEEFVQYLPDMDLAFNIHDESRVIVPHDDLARLVQIALKDNMPAAAANSAPRNSFSSRPQDMNSGKRIDEAKITRFNWYAHQPVWIPSRQSCHPLSPARALDETQARDNLTAYALGELEFIYNRTAFTDICQSPSLSSTYGFFDRPNAFNVVHDLFPVFSQSKISSFQDIIFPSPWYWVPKVEYTESKDMEWKKKTPNLFWRGSTTGGFSRDGGWRRQHRQNMVRKLNGLDEAKIMQDINKDAGGDKKPEWKVKEIRREDYKDAMDVHFSHIGQCDATDCKAQAEFFDTREEVGFQDIWKWRYLLDMDGNAFSGRFYAFLESHSLVFKMALFREWHEEWIKPWVHYVPLSLRGEEALEAVRYFSTEDEGKNSAVRIAEQGRERAQKGLRKADLEVWFFRLLLEYGRLVDDKRAEIGYSGS